MYIHCIFMYGPWLSARYDIYIYKYTYSYHIYIYTYVYMYICIHIYINWLSAREHTV